MRVFSSAFVGLEKLFLVDCDSLIGVLGPRERAENTVGAPELTIFPEFLLRGNSS